MNISINNRYCIRNEKECSYIVCKTIAENIKEKSFPLVMPIPPIYGYILSSFNGKEMEATINEITNTSGIKKEKIRNFVDKVFKNPHPYSTYINKEKIYLPSYLLVESSIESDISTEEDFHLYDKFIPKRPKRPFFINLMITSKCSTNCIYCYADRHRKDDMSLHSIIEILNRASKEKIPNLLISGGDILATKDWKIILGELTSLGYPQIISTKTPLNEEDILFLLKNKTDRIQVSIDSFNDIDLSNIIRVNSLYLKKMKRTFELADRLGLFIDIKTVLTKYNSDIETLKNMFEELSKYNCIKSWNIVPAFFSSHNELDYNTYKVDTIVLKKILDFFVSIKSAFPIEYGKIKDTIFTIQEQYKSEKDFVRKSKCCVANIYGLSIMSNGKATICEMLYYNENFYIGDITKDSIQNIWNSTSALNFNFINNQKKKNSPCYSCKELDKCKKTNLKKICIVDIINTYGSEKWEYPDPRCPKSINANTNKVIY